MLASPCLGLRAPLARALGLRPPGTGHHSPTDQGTGEEVYPMTTTAPAPADLSQPPQGVPLAFWQQFVRCFQADPKLLEHYARQHAPVAYAAPAEQAWAGRQASLSQAAAHLTGH